MTEQRTDYDSPWKEVIKLYFPRFLEFFFPLAYGAIDWAQPYEFLDTPTATARTRRRDWAASGG